MHTSIAGGAKETMQNILVVEDDRELNEALCYALEKQGYHTSAAFSIQEAKETYQSFTGRRKSPACDPRYQSARWRGICLLSVGESTAGHSGSFSYGKRFGRGRAERI